jgi:aldose sugar dehydrogenase
MQKPYVIPAIIIFITLTGIISLGISGKTLSWFSGQQQTAAANYQKFCSGCHGANLEKFAAKEWMEEEGSSAAARSIKFGIEDIGMPSFQKTFSEQEITALADYVKKGVPEDRSKLKPAVTLDGVTESETQKFVVETVVTGLKIPWGLAFLPNGDLLISEREGNTSPFFKRQTWSAD